MNKLTMMTLGVALMAAPAALTQTSWAQTPAPNYPTQMVRIMVPFGAGSNTDTQARLIADKLSEMWKQQVIVENRPGVAGTAAIAKMPADGYTLMLTSSGHAIAHVIHKNLPFDPIKDFVGVTQISVAPAALVAPLELPANSVAEFVALAKQKPGQLNFASAGTASTSYLAAEIFKSTAGINIVHIPHKGTPDAMNSILRNDSQLYFSTAGGVVELLEAKKIKVLAVSGAKRFALMPNTPTVAEGGLPEYAYDSWFGILAPTGVPKPILEKVSADIARVLRSPDIADKVAKQGLVIQTQSPDEFDKMVKSEAERFEKILRAAGVGAQ